MAISAEERIIRALPDCLTPQALWDISCHLGAAVQDQAALDRFWELVGQGDQS